ncbi:MAG: HD domain-containing protein [Bacteroidota bacterium]
MRPNPLIERTIVFVKKTLEHAEGGHDWFHTERVFKMAEVLAKEEHVDIQVVQLAALLHDIADSKFHNGDEEIGPRKAFEFLRSQKLQESTIQHVVHIIRFMSYKNSLDREAPLFSSTELQVVQDADRLDAMGAIGIARAFNYGGYKNRALYNPDIPPDLNLTKEAYKKSKAPTINHFYEKLLLLKNQMNTKAAQKKAEARHQFMLQFLDQFYKEWNP